jgi:dTDP-4-dehydrorhamnose reductase
MKILITGANGLVGQKILEQLLDRQDFEVWATGLGAARLPSLWDSKYTWISMDMRDATQVQTVMDHVIPDFVFHTAAMTLPDQCELNQQACWEVNVEAVKHLLEACRKTDCHLIHLSTDFIFDGEDGPYTEDAIPNPVNFYGKSKAAAEDLIKVSGVRHSIIRTVLVFGLGHDLSRSNIILWVKSSLEKNKRIRVVNDQWRTPTLVEDLAKGCIAVMDKRAEGIYNLAGKDLLTPYMMALQVAEYFELDRSLIEEVSAATFVEPARRPLRTGLIIARAQSLLNYDPKSFMEGVGILAKQLKLADS